MMNFVIFYCKPTCISNKKQIAQLKKLEIPLVVVDLFKESWTCAELVKYFFGLDKKLWFNPSSPRIKNAEIDIVNTSDEQLLQMMLDDPGLIRRPLIKFDDQYQVGFNLETIIAMYDKDHSYKPHQTISYMEICARAQL